MEKKKLNFVLYYFGVQSILFTQNQKLITTIVPIWLHKRLTFNWTWNMKIIVSVFIRVVEYFVKLTSYFEYSNFKLFVSDVLITKQLWRSTKKRLVRTAQM